MRRPTAVLLFASLFAFLVLSPKLVYGQSDAGSVTVLLKDGHRQTFRLADVDRIELTGSVPSNLVHFPGPSRSHFLGKWEVGEGSGRNFTITLNDDGSARRSTGNAHGTWKYVNGEAQIRWPDGWSDCIRKVGAWYKKYAYHDDQAFSGTPENVTDARNLTQNPSGVD
jgi:hypothetical protein